MPEYEIEVGFIIEAENALQAYVKLVHALEPIENDSGVLDWYSCPRSETLYATNQETGEEEEFGAMLEDLE